ncbi:MAG: bacterial transcriptional activator domain-containing protein, partial [Actinomycetota bacterium]|nr:bacterial transcriptional activator domain-containing protein [Actinomycetota bacterium]
MADRLRVSLADDTPSDVQVFLGALAETTRHGHEKGEVCDACLPLLDLATGLYRGDFLEGFSLRDAPSFDDWARTVSESLRIKAGEAFNRLAIARAAAGDYSGAMAAVGKWVDLDPLHEPAYRLMMLL